MTVKQYTEPELTTVSAGISSRHPCGEREGSLTCEMLLIMVLTALNVFSRKRPKEVLTIKAFNNASVENFRQTKLQITANRSDIEVETKRDR